MRPSAKFYALIALLIVITAAGFSVLGVALYLRFTQGTRQFHAISKVTVENRRVARSTCQADNEIRKVLRDEHTTKLRRTREYLKDHPHGTHDIPLGLIKAGIVDEKTIIDHVQPHPCS